METYRTEKKKNNPIGFVERLNEKVYQSDITLIELSKRCDIHKHTLYRILDGTITTNIMTLCKLCETLKTSPNYLLFGKEKL